MNRRKSVVSISSSASPSHRHSSHSPLHSSSSNVNSMSIAATSSAAAPVPAPASISPTISPTSKQISANASDLGLLKLVVLGAKSIPAKLGVLCRLSTQSTEVVTRIARKNPTNPNWEEPLSLIIPRGCTIFRISIMEKDFNENTVELCKGCVDISELLQVPKKTDYSARFESDHSAQLFLRPVKYTAPAPLTCAIPSSYPAHAARVSRGHGELIVNVMSAVNLLPESPMKEVSAQCEVIIGSQIWNTPVVEGSNHPIWAESFLCSVEPAVPSIEFVVYDTSGTVNEFLGLVRVDLNEKTEEEDGWVSKKLELSPFAMPRDRVGGQLWIQYKYIREPQLPRVIEDEELSGLSWKEEIDSEYGILLIGVLTGHFDAFQSYFCDFSLGGKSPPVKSRVTRPSSNPTWLQPLKVPIAFGTCTLECRIRENDAIRDSPVIGVAEIEFSTIDSTSVIDKCIFVANSTGRGNLGTIRLQFRIERSVPVPRFAIVDDPSSRELKSKAGIGCLEVVVICAVLASDKKRSFSPVCSASLGMQEFRTHVAGKSKFPIWNEGFAFDILPGSLELKCLVFAENTSQEAVGFVSIPLASLRPGHSLDQTWPLAELKMNQETGRQQHNNNNNNNNSNQKSNKQQQQSLRLQLRIKQPLTLEAVSDSLPPGFGRLEVTVVSAKNLSSSERKIILDPFCELSCGPSHACTKKALHATTPVWDEVVVLDVPPFEWQLNCAVKHWHPDGSTPTIGTIRIWMAELSKDVPFESWYALEQNPSSEVRLRLEMKIMPKSPANRLTAPDGVVAVRSTSMLQAGKINVVVKGARRLRVGGATISRMQCCLKVGRTEILTKPAQNGCSWNEVHDIDIPHPLSFLQLTIVDKTDNLATVAIPLRTVGLGENKGKDQWFGLEALENQTSEQLEGSDSGGEICLNLTCEWVPGFRGWDEMSNENASRLLCPWGCGMMLAPSGRDEHFMTCLYGGDPTLEITCCNAYLGCQVRKSLQHMVSHARECSFQSLKLVLRSQKGDIHMLAGMVTKLQEDRDHLEQNLRELRSVLQQQATASSISGESQQELHHRNEDPDGFRARARRGTEWVPKRCVHSFQAHQSAVTALSLWHEEGKMLSGGGDGLVHFWHIPVDESAPQKVGTLQGHTGGVLSVAITKEHCYTGSEDHTMKEWDPETMQNIHTFSGHQGRVHGVICYRNIVFSIAHDKRIMVWDTRQEHSVATFELTSRGNWGMAMLDLNLYSASNRELRSWDIRKLAKSKMDSAQAEALTQYKFLAGNAHGVWGHCVANNVLYAPSADSSINVWDFAKGKCVNNLSGHSDFVRGITSAYSKLFTTSDDSSIKVWDLSYPTPAVMRTLRGHDGFVTSVVEFRERLFTGAEDRTIKIWE